jgi:hypothetical protein
MSEFDRGPTARFAKLFDRVPDPTVPREFWFDWGPVFYRGRLDGSARVLRVASDPGPTERIAGRGLVGNAGQRVQGSLADDAWVRAKPRGAQNSVERPSPDDAHTLIWHAPGGAP